MKKYVVFTRTWWRENPEWPNGLEPFAGSRKIISYTQTAEDARQIAQEWNAKHNPGRLSRKAEFDVNIKDSSVY